MRLNDSFAVQRKKIKRMRRRDWEKKRKIMKIRNAQTHSARLILQVINSCGEIPVAHTLTHTMHLFVYNLLLSSSLQTVVNSMDVMLRIVKNRRLRLGRTIWISLTGSTRSTPVCVYWTNLWIVRVTMQRAMIATIDREEERETGRTI